MHSHQWRSIYITHVIRHINAKSKPNVNFEHKLFNGYLSMCVIEMRCWNPPKITDYPFNSAMFKIRRSACRYWVLFISYNLIQQLFVRFFKYHLLISIVCQV